VVYRGKWSKKVLKIRDMHVSGQVKVAAPKLLFFEVLNALRASHLFTGEELKIAANSLLNYRIEWHQLGK